MFPADYLFVPKLTFFFGRTVSGAAFLGVHDLGRFVGLGDTSGEYLGFNDKYFL